MAQDIDNGLEGTTEVSPLSLDEGGGSDISEFANGPWLMFVWIPGVVGTFADECRTSCVAPIGIDATRFFGSPPWEFSVQEGGTAELTVTDAFSNGDRFEVFDDQVSIGVTSEVGYSGGCGPDPEVCLTDPGASSGVFLLEPGLHAITIQLIQSTFSLGGAGYFRVDGDVVVDSDGDGVPDAEDACVLSDLRASVIVDGCDSGAQNTLFEDGCTISDRVAECGTDALTHGAFGSCVAQLTDSLKKEGILSGDDEGAIVSCAGMADIP